MSSFKFNKIYVIESLDEKTEKLTGKELYDDLLRWQQEKYNELEARYFSIINKNDFFKVLEDIKSECKTVKSFPILHLEMHGASEKTGLVLKSKELIEWKDLYQSLIEINISVENNLFLTLAVCYGAYLMQLIDISNPAPFYGFIGSFDEIKVYDLLIRYNEFYCEFFSSFKLEEALRKLHEVNTGIPSTYKAISIEQTFVYVYKKYISEELSKEGIEKRKKQVSKGLKFSNRNQRRKFERDFENKLIATKEQYYKEHSTIFFMLDKYPQNRDRFNIPESFKKFISIYK